MDTVKCLNHELCGTMLPDWWLECKSRNLCTNCDMMFGSWKSGNITKTGKRVLSFYDNVQCPICLDEKRCVSQPVCDHVSCIDCFRRCFYGEERIGEPEFPYPEIEDEYFEEIEKTDEEWEMEYPLIKKYNEDWNIWEDEREMKYQQEEYLRSCPICRKHN